jgi:hypothetical protein
MWAFTVLGMLALVFAILLRRNEAGPRGHGLDQVKRAEV